MRNKREKIMDRVNKLLEMDRWLFENVGDDVYIDIWQQYGLEDGATEDLEILREYAGNDELWRDCLLIFNLAVEEEKRIN